MATAFRLVWTILLIALILNGCRAPMQKTSPQREDNISADTEYLKKGKNNGTYWPTKEWRECEPEAVGMNSAKLLKAIEYAATPAFKTDGIVVIRKGHVVGEAYFAGFKRNSKHISYSMAKSFTSALVGIAIDKGY